MCTSLLHNNTDNDWPNSHCDIIASYYFTIANSCASICIDHATQMTKKTMFVVNCMYVCKAKRGGGNNCCNNVGLRTNKKINIKAFCLRK